MKSKMVKVFSAACATALALCLFGCDSSQGGEQPANTKDYDYKGIRLAIPDGWESEDLGDGVRLVKEDVEGGILISAATNPAEVQSLDASKVMSVQTATQQIPSSMGLNISEEPNVEVVQGHPMCSIDSIEGENDFLYDVRGFGFDDHIVVLIASSKGGTNEEIKSIVGSCSFTEDASAGLTAAAEDIAAGKTPKKDYSGQYEPEIGMSESDVLSSSWGEPEKRNVTESANSKKEQWVYSNNKYIYFENGVVTSIQKSE